MFGFTFFNTFSQVYLLGKRERRKRRVREKDNAF